jgi:hypothetical protein
MIAYIFERFVIHFFAACSLVLCAYFGFSWLAREYNLEFIPAALQARLAFSALFVWSLSTLREAFDVSRGVFRLSVLVPGLHCCSLGFVSFCHLKDE